MEELERSIDVGLNTIDKTLRRPPQEQHRISCKNTRRTNSDQSIGAGRETLWRGVD
jgi:hypothetical protein